MTVVTWGATGLQIASKPPPHEADGISAEVIDLRTIVPWDKCRRCSSPLRRTAGRSSPTRTRTPRGFGAEISATIAEEAFEHLDAPPKRLAAPDTPVPFSPVLEQAFIPQAADVTAAIRELVAY